MKNKFIQHWNERSKGERIIIVSQLVVSIAIIILAIIQLTGVWEYAINVFEPLVAILMLLQALLWRKRSKLICIFSLCVAIFIFIVSVILFTQI